MAKTTRQEMAFNAARWAEAAKKDLPKDLGFIFLLMPKESLGQGQGVAASNLQKRAVIDELKAVLRKHNEQPLIVLPGETN